MNFEIRQIVFFAILFMVSCSKIDIPNDEFVSVQSTVTVKKYTIIDTIILDSADIPLSDVPIAHFPLCRTDTTYHVQYLDSVCFPSDIVKIEFNSYRNSVNYLKRTYKMQKTGDSVLFIGTTYSPVSPCETLDTSNKLINYFTLSGNLKEVRQINLFAQSKNKKLFWWFNAIDVKTLISDRKMQLANWNRVRDSIVTSGGTPPAQVRQFNWSTGLRDTGYYYYVNVRFSLPS